MHIRRTDLAMEAKELWEESAGETTKLSGVEAHDSKREGLPVTTVHILDETGSRELGKPTGQYVTITLDALQHREEDAFGRAVRVLSLELKNLIDSIPKTGCVLVVGLGNRAITPDAIGPKVQEQVLVTRHLVQGIPARFGTFRPVAAIAPGVLGTTGMESGELLESICRDLRPSGVIVVDALASRSLTRLCRTIQLTDTGIVPGSGVGNHRAALSQRQIGIPVIAVGVPTVVEAGTLLADFLKTEEPPDLGEDQALFVTPKDIDRQIDDLSKVIGYGISMALQPELCIEDLTMLLA